MSRYIRIKEFCKGHEIAESFIYDLQEFHLIRIQFKDEEPSFDEEALPGLEKLLRLHRELDINPEGLHAVNHLLLKLQQSQEEVRLLKVKINRLKQG